MELMDFFPNIWENLSNEEQALLTDSAQTIYCTQGTILHQGSNDCQGVLAVKSGMLRVYIISDEGRDVTLYRLLPYDFCLFSASCMLPDIQFDILIEAEKDSELFSIPAPIYEALMKSSLAISKFTNQLMAARFTDVMWRINQILFQKMDRRIADFLLSECSLEGTATLKITHEKIASHVGTAREVVTRTLKYMQTEGLITLSRGMITVIAPDRLSS